MGFSAPKPDPKIAQQQAAAAADARRQKINSIQPLLADEDKIRHRLYGTKPKPLFGQPPAGQPQFVNDGLSSLFVGMYGNGGGGATLV